MVRHLVALLITTVMVGSTALAHKPCRECQRVTPRVDVIGPVGNDLPPEYRRVCNRPRYIVGKLAYWVAPTSQEAIAWHKAMHRGAYEKKLGRIEPHYFYPKPWETLRRGPRVSLASQKLSGDATMSAEPMPFQDETATESLKDDEMALEDEEDVPSLSDLPASNSGSPKETGVEPQSLGDDTIVDELLPAPNNATDAVGSGVKNENLMKLLRNRQQAEQSTK